MNNYPDDIYTEPSGIDVNTLAKLGPLTPLAGRWKGTKGVDVNPKADGPRTQVFVEIIDLAPLDPQTNGPQLLYGLRYHQHATKPGETETYHDQVGYFLWEPATGTIYQSLSIPRGQTLLAMGRATADARRFELVASRGSVLNGIVSNPYLDEAFRTIEYRIAVTVNDDGTWAYEEDTVLLPKGAREPFHHTDRSTLVKIGEPEPNPLAR